MTATFSSVYLSVSLSLSVSLFVCVCVCGLSKHNLLGRIYQCVRISFRFESKQI